MSLMLRVSIVNEFPFQLICFWYCIFFAQLNSATP